MPVQPSVRSFLIADSVFQQMSGKWCVIGVFDRVCATSFPVVQPLAGLFVQLSDAEGTYDVKVDFCGPDGTPLARFSGLQLTVADRLAPAYVGIQTYNLKIPGPGRYYFKLFFNDKEVEPEIPIDAELVAP